MDKAEYGLVKDGVEKRDLCGWIYGCPKINGEEIDCPDCPAHNDDNEYTYDEAKEIMENWKKAQEE